MNRFWAPLVVAGLLASATASGPACSRSSLHATRPDGSAERPVSDTTTDGQVPADVQVLADAARTDVRAPSVCGNGRLDPGEQCDDGNTLDGDYCTKNCKLDMQDHPHCGDGRVAADEICDDGNAISGDGCSGDCKTIEAGFRCPKPGKICVPICGDGLLVGWESLLASEPSCDPNDQPGSRCGDGQVTGYEDCDCGDGTMMFPLGCAGPNDDSYGGCTTKCTWGPFCGDGLVNGDEDCDLANKDGSLLGPDGCTAGCTTPHYCGDGILDTDRGEECDLGDLNGLRLDRDGKPSDLPADTVKCEITCKFHVFTS